MLLVIADPGTTSVAARPSTARRPLNQRFMLAVTFFRVFAATPRVPIFHRTQASATCSSFESAGFAGAVGASHQPFVRSASSTSAMTRDFSAVVTTGPRCFFTRVPSACSSHCRHRSRQVPLPRFSSLMPYGFRSFFEAASAFVFAMGEVLLPILRHVTHL